MPDMEEWRGVSVSQTFAVTTQDVDAFAGLCGDRHPLHCDPAFAAARGYRDRVVHGAFLGALASAAFSAKLPGAESLVLQKLDLQFRKPAYPGDQLTVTLDVADIFASVQAIRLSVKIRNQQDALLCTGTIQAGIPLSAHEHDQRP